MIAKMLLASRRSDPLTRGSVPLFRLGLSPQTPNIGSRYRSRHTPPHFPASGSARFGEGASNDSGVIENIDFQCFRALHRRNIKKYGHYLVPYRLSTDPKTLDFEWPYMAILR